jgi:hypothetical protein
MYKMSFFYENIIDHIIFFNFLYTYKKTLNLLDIYYIIVISLYDFNLI